MLSLFSKWLGRIAAMMALVWVWSLPVAAVVLVDVSSPIGGSQNYYIGSDSWFGFAFSLKQPYNDVALETVFNWANVTGTAYLTKGGNAPANLVTSLGFTPTASNTPFTVMDHLNLDPGDYFLTLAADTGPGWIRGVLPGTVVSEGPDASYGGSFWAYNANAPLNHAFPPASSWATSSPIAFHVTGTEIPTPSTAASILAGLGALALRRVRRGR